MLRRGWIAVKRICPQVRLPAAGPLACVPIEKLWVCRPVVYRCGQLCKFSCSPCRGHNTAAGLKIDESPMMSGSRSNKCPACSWIDHYHPSSKPISDEESKPVALPSVTEFPAISRESLSEAPPQSYSQTFSAYTSFHCSLFSPTVLRFVHRQARWSHSECVFSLGSGAATPATEVVVSLPREMKELSDCLRRT